MRHSRAYNFQEKRIMGKKHQRPSAEDCCITIDIAVMDAFDYIARNRNPDATLEDLQALSVLFEIRKLTDKLYPLVSGRLNP